MVWSQEGTLGTSVPWPLGTVSRLEPWWAWGLGVEQWLGRYAEDPSLSCQGPCSPRSAGQRWDTCWEDPGVEKAPSEHLQVGWGREGTPKRASSTKGRQGGSPHTPRGHCSLQRPHPRSRKESSGTPTPGSQLLLCGPHLREQPKSLVTHPPLHLLLGLDTASGPLSSTWSELAGCSVARPVGSEVEGITPTRSRQLGARHPCSSLKQGQAWRGQTLAWRHMANG